MVRTIPVRTLVIDDDAAVGRKVAGWLREAACDVVCFTSPAEGLTHVSRAPCLVGFVDLRLEDASGIDVIASLRQAAPGMRLIAMSAFPDAQQVIAAMRAGASDLLEKPIQQPALLGALERQLLALGVVARSEQEFNRRLGGRVRAERTRSGRTLAEIAAECGLTASQLSQIELGKSATTTWGLARICSALRVPMGRLLSEL
jgi:DNA-binding NtrC family response regulator